MSRPRRGWRELVEPGIYRVHRLACRSSDDLRPGRSCGCSWQIRVPGGEVGKYATQTLPGDTSLRAVRARRREAQAAGRRPAQDIVSVPTVRAYFAHWMRSTQPSTAASTMVNREVQYRLRIDPRFGADKITDLTKTAIQAWVNAMHAAGPSEHAAKRGYTGERSVEFAHNVLSAMLGFAVIEEVIDRNPAEKILLPTRAGAGPSDSQNVLDRTQVARLLSTCRNRRDRTIVLVAIETGCRRGEVAAINWSAFDFERRRIWIGSSLWQGKQVGKVRKLPKDEDGSSVAISDHLAAELAAYRDELRDLGRDVVSGPVWPGRGPRGQGLEWRHDQPMSPDSFTKIVRRLLVKAGLVDSNGKPLLPMKNLRHTAASIPLSSGVPLVVVSAQLGHSRTTTTASFYEHLLNDGQLDRFAEVFDPAPPHDAADEAD